MAKERIQQRRDWRAESAAFFLNHRAVCLLTATLLAACAVLGFLRPPMAKIRAQISPRFVRESGSRYSEAKVNLLVIGIARGRNVKTGDTETYVGFAGKIFQADLNRELDLKAKAEKAEKERGETVRAPLTKTERREYQRQKLLENVADIVLWIPPLLDGSKITVSLTILSTLTGAFLSIFMALGKISKFKPLSKLCSAYIFVFRGSPLLMQLFFIYFGLPLINPNLNIQDRFTAAYIAFTLNSIAYMAEIIRAAIQSIDKGQFEASKALGLTYGQTMRLVVIPQSIRRLIPPVANEFIMVLKDASLVSIISLSDLAKVTQTISTTSGKVLVYIPSIAIYLIITALFTFIFNRLEKRFSIYQ
ncbi:MAG: amino acid ABC transporter permease [Oscillospiraceae bacterium]|jgi:polar amino acid transport system permease protein|nr:amino acid ABC transporter permease [Oscillospiraceae bacterium]